MDADKTGERTRPASSSSVGHSIEAAALFVRLWSHNAMTIETQIQLLKYRRTKIVATLGPASGERDTIEKLLESGADVFRLNMSHGDHASHRTTFGRIREVARSSGRRPTAVLVDLSGPKIRVGRFRNGRIPLIRDHEVTLTTRDVMGEERLIPSQYAALADDVSPGDSILLDDGTLELEVLRVEGTEINAAVKTGGVLKDHKGMNLPGVNLSTPSLTEKDRNDARFALDLGVEYLALSFVRRAEDVDELRELIRLHGAQASIIAKIETPQALDDISGILDGADGIMVARGDLGVELPPQSVPLVQSQLIDLARDRAKPVIVATQMLESMIHSPRPTRAEVSDVSLAVRSGADAVMLSAESAAGSYPIEAVSMMDTIARETEAYLWQQGAFGSLTATASSRGSVANDPSSLSVEDALARSTAQLSRDLQVRSIVVLSRSGRTASIMSSFRPAAPVVVTSPDPATCRRTTLLWGVIPVVVDTDELSDPRSLARRLASELGFGSDGQKILVVQGFGPDPEHDTPSITVVTI